MRGKKGPIPEPLHTEDPEIEEIVGEENVIDVGDVAETADALMAVLPPGYKCSLPGCAFTSQLLSEIDEHVNGTGHGGFKAADAVQPELFSTPGVVHRMINVSLPKDLLDGKRERLASLYQSALDIKEEKKGADSDFNARLKNIDEQMQEIARVLKTPYTYEKIDCEWRIIEEENARGLYRLDTGELLEKQPLTQEDRAAELQKAEVDNAEVPA